MIISDKFQFAFIHIPKCAGTNIKRALVKYDDLNGRHTNRVDNHAKLGLIDYVHIPLEVLKYFFQDEYRKVEQYESFAVVRDPFSRFFSSVSEHMKAYTGEDVRSVSKKKYISRIGYIIDELWKMKGLEVLPYNYIHFQRQCSFIYCEDVRIIKHIYLTSELKNLVADLEKIINQRLDWDPDGPIRDVNTATVYRSDFSKRLVQIFRPIFDRPARLILSANNIRKIQNMLYTHQSDAYAEIYKMKFINDFICQYYKKDIELYESLRLKSPFANPVTP